MEGPDAPERTYMDGLPDALVVLKAVDQHVAEKRVGQPSHAVDDRTQLLPEGSGADTWQTAMSLTLESEGNHGESKFTTRGTA